MRNFSKKIFKKHFQKNFQKKFAFSKKLTIFFSLVQINVLSLTNDLLANCNGILGLSKLVL